MLLHKNSKFQLDVWKMRSSTGRPGYGHSAAAQITTTFANYFRSIHEVCHMFTVLFMTETQSFKMSGVLVKRK